MNSYIQPLHVTIFIVGILIVNIHKKSYLVVVLPRVLFSVLVERLGTYYSVEILLTTRFIHTIRFIKRVATRNFASISNLYKAK